MNIYSYSNFKNRYLPNLYKYPACNVDFTTVCKLCIQRIFVHYFHVNYDDNENDYDIVGYIRYKCMC